MSSEKAKKDQGPSLESNAKNVALAPPSEVRLKASVSAAELRAFLALPATQDRIQQIVAARVDKNAPDWLREELAQETNRSALVAKSPPQSMETAIGWLGMVTVRTVVNHFRREAVDIKYLRRDTDVEELPSEPEESRGFVAPEWLLTEWLRPRVAGNPRHQETYELLVYKANTGKTHAQVAADHAMTEGALKSRIHALKTAYEPQWRRRQRMLLLLILFGVAAIAAIVWLLWPPDVGPNGMRPPTTTPNLDRVLGSPLPVSHPRLDAPDAAP